MIYSVLAGMYIYYVRDRIGGSFLSCKVGRLLRALLLYNPKPHIWLKKDKQTIGLGGLKEIIIENDSSNLLFPNSKECIEVWRQVWTRRKFWKAVGERGLEDQIRKANFLFFVC